MRPVLFVLFGLACAGEEPTAPAPPPEPAVPAAADAQGADENLPEAPAAPDHADVQVKDCAAVEFEQGVTGTYKMTAEGDHHMKHHFAMPEGKDALVVKASWPDESWKLAVDVGTGDCPHSGRSCGRLEGNGTVEFKLLPADVEEGLESFTAGEKWFLHLGATGEQEEGSEVAYTIDVQACNVARDAAAEAPAEEAAAPAAKKAPPTSGTRQPATRSGSRDMDGPTQGTRK